MLQKDGEASVRCHFCSEWYTFGQEDLERLIGELRTPGHN
ncbi:MAG: Hsp33 family molecular chaperone HslO [Firmicutes bacterium]|nr:Hsp33 family molecular chaperone HslO [Bacillota bacterium]MBU4554703.1 Hsp33 family molecular chaperone HslO [Bacillota bacterium]MBV1726740.1 Hsp33 family molecular chaperone HslO [Desulforudis sp.]MBV1735640.1 Hsp33 family molecular chaperone HslO [Desulforudis sp.]MBV1769380.1 Hsp33 family molecular chaperone HslO [Desulforudis sp.]